MAAVTTLNAYNAQLNVILFIPVVLVAHLMIAQLVYVLRMCHLPVMLQQHPALKAMAPIIALFVNYVLLRYLIVDQATALE